ncbi:MAG: ring-1,2-phenylacetyl-CoA epoxidase subunit PaaD [Phenylobacterium sp.]|jgi:ring-1,2-phenylacetyl-CoA epoxidase subunit PaaD
MMSEQLIPTVNPIYAERRRYRAASEHQTIWAILDGVFDPELPGLTIWDLGVLQDVRVEQDFGACNTIVVITPTYSGCPAVDAMKQDIVTALNGAGYEQVTVEVTLSPAWGTEMISPSGKVQLANLHIAPPQQDDQPDCPVCSSSNTEVLSQFGSTACKAMYRCQDCFEVFDYFKTL